MTVGAIRLSMRCQITVCGHLSLDLVQSVNLRHWEKGNSLTAERDHACVAEVRFSPRATAANFKTGKSVDADRNDRRHFVYMQFSDHLQIASQINKYLQITPVKSS
jgi:hypothetical protein